MKKDLKFESGFSILEVILAVALFLLFSIGVGQVINQGFNANRLGEELTVANQFAAEGLEAVRSIRNQSYTNLVDSSGTGLTKSGTTWAFGGANNTLTHNTSDNFIRTIQVSDVYRDSNGNIVPSPTGTLDPNTKNITSTVSWNFNVAHPETVLFSTYLSNWKKSLQRGGMLVYGDGGTTTDIIRYRVLDASTGTWGSVQTLDVDSSTSNKVLRAVRIYASQTRNEKIALTKHYDGSKIWIYGSVYNGTSWSSLNFTSWTASSFDSSNLDVRFFDGDYLNNGNFLAVYADNTSIPKYRIWDGGSWSAESSLVNLAQNSSGIPVYIVARTRPGTNELMAVLFGQQKDTNTEYFNGSSWSLHAKHASNASANNKELIGFTWSPNLSINNLGALIFSSANNDKRMHLKIFTAVTGAVGGGTWGSVVNAPSQGTLGAMDIGGRVSAGEFLACDKDTNNNILCFKSNTTPTWSTPTNNTLTLNTDTGTQRSYDLVYKATSGAEAITVYSDNTSTPKLKKYNPTTSTFDSTATNIPVLSAVLKTVRLSPESDNDDIMILMGDGNRRLFTADWDGTNDVIFTTPSGKAFTTQGTNGSAVNEFWFDFAWDKF